MFSKTKKTKIVDRLKQDRRNFFLLLAGETFGIPLTWYIASTIGVVLFGPLAYTAAAISSIVSVGRLGIFFDFYARSLNERGRGNKLTHSFCEQWLKTPMGHLSQWKLENDKRDYDWRVHVAKLDERMDQATSKIEKTERKRDIKQFLFILNKLYPNRNIIWSSGAGAVSVGFARQIYVGFVNHLPPSTQFVNGCLSLLTASYSSAHLLAFAAKKQANGTSNAITDKIINYTEKTPLKFWGRKIVRRQINKIDRLEISVELVQDLIDLEISKTLKELSDFSHANPQGILRDLFARAAWQEEDRNEENIRLALAIVIKQPLQHPHPSS